MVHRQRGAYSTLPAIECLAISSRIRNNSRGEEAGSPVQHTKSLRDHATPVEAASIECVIPNRNLNRDSPE